jgi:hypothetical protein
LNATQALGHKPGVFVFTIFETRNSKISGSNGICGLPSPPGRKRLGYRAAPDKSDFLDLFTRRCHLVP